MESSVENQAGITSVERVAVGGGILHGIIEIKVFVLI